MRFIQNLSIRRKLLLTTIVTCTTALLLACLALFTHEVKDFKRDMVGDLSAQANVLAGLSTAALTFEDNATTTEMLSELRHEPRITMAVIFREGLPFAAYKRHGILTPLPKTIPHSEGLQFQQRRLSLCRSIFIKNSRLGTLYLQADMTQLYHRLWQYAAILLAVFIAASFIAFLLAKRLQSAITKPIERLSEAAQAIAERKDYSVRAEKMGQDELGGLTDAFNQMLHRIEAQDLALRENQERYEVAVLGSSDGLWDWDLTTNQVHFSPRWKEMIGFADEELASTYANWEERLHPEDRDQVLQSLQDYLDGKHPTYTAEFRLLHKDGSYRWILSRGAALRDARGKPHRLAGAQTDITQRKEAEQRLEELHKQLLNTSRQAGMAEVATGVLHNVGNVLNSVNVSATLLVQHVRETKLSNLKKAIGLINEHRNELADFLTTDPKGKLLPEYLVNLTELLLTEQSDNLKELDALTKNIDHVKQIVATQQNYAKVSGLLEPIQVEELVEDAFYINGAALARHRVEVIREFEPVQPVIVDKHKVLQILVNLIGNAKYALREAHVEQKRITVGIKPTQDRARVVLTVRDNGIGISPENLQRIFTHGFTTKEEGHGFGLHSGALAAKQMGGSLRAQSNGPNTGATFTLELPTAQANSRQEAA